MQQNEANPLLVVDESLSPNVAKALKLVDYNAQSSIDIFGQGTVDETIIPWIGLEGGIWITADEAAKRKHAQEIRQAGIHVIWVQRPKRGMSGKEQLFLLLGVLEDILGVVKTARRSLYFRAYYKVKRPRFERLD